MMEPTRSSDKELFDLLDALSQNRITPQQAKRLEQWVCEDARARELYVQYMHLCAHLPRFLELDPQEESLEHVREILERFASDDRVAPLEKSSELELSEMELLVSTENIRAMLEEDAEIEHHKAKERARIETLAAEKFAAFRREQNRNHRPEPVAASRNALYTTVSSLAAAAILFILWMLPDPVPTPIFVASINDSIDAQWSDPSLSTASGTQLFTLGNLVLTHGVVEIEFEGGAKAIVEAPATLELLSPDSARLDWGKLVGHVPRSEVQLTIKTPNASVTDLGTEFGVEVDRQQVTHLHVFEGSVSAATIDAEGKTAQQQTVLVDEAVYLQPKTGAIEPAPVAAADRFVRRLLFPLPLYSTGVGLAEGDDDPHWQIIAAQNVPNFSPQPAIVTTPAPVYMPNDSRQSQWVSLTKNRLEVGPEARYTFSTTFDLSGFDPQAASIGGSFIVDNQVTAIRVNGIEIPVPEHPVAEYRKMFSFSVDSDHLKTGRNQIELDIFNGGAALDPDGSETALRVVLKGMGPKTE